MTLSPLDNKKQKVDGTTAQPDCFNWTICRMSPAGFSCGATLRDVGGLSICGLGDCPSSLSPKLCLFMHVCTDWKSKQNKPSVQPIQPGSLQTTHRYSPVKLHYVWVDAFSDQQPLSEEEAGSGRAFGSGPLLQAAPAPSIALVPNGQPKPGLSAGTVSGGMLADCGAASYEQEVEEEVACGSALVVTRSVAVERPAEGEAEAGWWPQGLWYK